MTATKTRWSKNPPHDAYWVDPGRLLAGPYPGAKEGLQAKPKLDNFLDLGVTCFIDLTEEAERQLGPDPVEPYDDVLRTLAEARGIHVTYRRMPIRDVDIPPAGAMREIQAEIARALDSRNVVYVHCWGGVGRTGTAIGCWLVEDAGYSGAKALQELKRLRRNTRRAERVSPETDEQRTMVRRWASA